MVGSYIVINCLFHLYYVACVIDTYVEYFPSIVLLFLLPLDSVLNITIQPSGFGQNTVGQRQYMICSISVPAGVDPDTVELGWLNEDDIITDDSRVTVDASSDYFNDSTLVTTIKFDPLSEEDEDEYICYVIINGSFIFESISLQNIISKLILELCMYVRTYTYHVRMVQINHYLLMNTFNLLMQKPHV